MAQQLVKPAGAGHETTWVALCALTILLVPGGWQRLRDRLRQR